jgi:hypothetical protein
MVIMGDKVGRFNIGGYHRGMMLGLLAQVSWGAVAFPLRNAGNQVWLHSPDYQGLAGGWLALPM